MRLLRPHCLLASCLSEPRGKFALVRRWSLVAAVAMFGTTMIATASAQPLPAQRLEPIRLVRPLASESLKRLFDEAESLYRARQYPQAMEAFRQLVEYDPEHAQAWLRIGNLHQHRRELGRAAQAFRKVVALGGPSADDEARRKALLNLGLIGLQEVRLVLRSLERSGGGASASEVSVMEQLEEDVGSLEAAMARWSRQGADAGTSAGSVAPAGADRPERPDRPDRAAGRTRSTPPIETIRGAPQP